MIQVKEGILPHTTREFHVNPVNWRRLSLDINIINGTQSSETKDKAIALTQTDLKRIGVEKDIGVTYRGQDIGYGLTPVGNETLTVITRKQRAWTGRKVSSTVLQLRNGT